MKSFNFSEVNDFRNNSKGNKTHDFNIKVNGVETNDKVAELKEIKDTKKLKYKKPKLMSLGPSDALDKEYRSPTVASSRKRRGRNFTARTATNLNDKELPKEHNKRRGGNNRSKRHQSESEKKEGGFIWDVVMNFIGCYE